MLDSQRVRIVTAVEVAIGRQLGSKEHNSLVGMLEEILPADPSRLRYELALVHRDIEKKRAAEIVQAHLRDG